MVTGDYKILLLWSRLFPKTPRLNVRAVSELVVVVSESMRSQVVRLTDVQRVPQHQIAQAPQGICHGGVGSFAFQPVRRQPALLLFGEVSVTPPSCGQDKTFDDANYNKRCWDICVATNHFFSHQLLNKDMVEVQNTRY